MVRLLISLMALPDKYWLFYTNDSEMNNVWIGPAVQAILKEFLPMSRPIASELFNVGHLVLFAPLKHSLFQILRYWLSGEKPDEAHWVFYRPLNWCSIMVDRKLRNRRI